MVKKGVLFSFVVLIIGVLSGCGCSKNDVVEPVNTEPIEDVERVEEELFTYPLTGITTKADVTGRAMAVVINNHPKARPQSGIHQADIVFELLAEGNVTRFLAIFQSEQPNKIGPVRSARDYFIELAKGYDSIFVAHGYSPSAYALLQSGYIDELNGMSYDGTLFKRSSDRQAPHNSYISYSNIVRGGEQKGYDLSTSPKETIFLTEEEMEYLEGTSTSAVEVNYSSSSLFNVTYEYDRSLGKFERFSNGRQAVDHETGDPLLIDNLFIVEAKHQVIDSEGRRMIDLKSGGKGYLVQKGKRQEVEWKNVDGRIVPYLAGEQLPMAPGKTWVNFVPNQPGLANIVSFRE